MPSVAFVVALVPSTAGPAVAMRDLPVGTSYAVRVGIGAVRTVAHATATGPKSVPVVEVLLLAGIVGCVVGLEVLHRPPPGPGRSRRGACVGRDPRRPRPVSRAA